MTSCPTSPGNFTSHFFTSSASAAAHQNLITSGKPVRLLTPPSFQPGLYQATSQTTTERQECQDINTTCKLAHAHARAQTLSHTLGWGEGELQLPSAACYHSGSSSPLGGNHTGVSALTGASLLHLLLLIPSSSQRYSLRHTHTSCLFIHP